MSLDEMREFILENEIDLTVDEINDLFAVARCTACSVGNSGNT